MFYFGFVLKILDEFWVTLGCPGGDKRRNSGLEAKSESITSSFSNSKSSSLRYSIISLFEKLWGSYFISSSISSITYPLNLTLGGLLGSWYSFSYVFLRVKNPIIRSKLSFFASVKTVTSKFAYFSYKFLLEKRESFLFSDNSFRLDNVLFNLIKEELEILFWKAVIIASSTF